jgi:hypothetical protein
MRMKKIAIMFLGILFLANMVAVSAWAKPCMQDAGLHAAQPMHGSHAHAQPGDKSEPCHGAQNKNDSSLHCEGLCLCVHASVHQTPILNDISQVYVPVTRHAAQYMTDRQLRSIPLAPERRPPRYNV